MGLKLKELFTLSIDRKQHKLLLWISLTTLIIALACIVGVYLVGVLKNVPPGFMTEDPLQTAKFPWYTGALSNLGIILWSISIGCAFTGAILAIKKPHKFQFMIVSGVLSSILVVDDMFMLHDGFLRYSLHIPERPIFLAYGLIFVVYTLYFLRDILSDDSFLILFVALLFLGSSMVIDAVIPYSSLETFIEDGIKFIGITFWAAYFLTAAVRFNKVTN
jgi:hypothetical protein